jgi:segregation and condensation protein B
MDEKHRKEERLKLKELRKELEEKIKGIIPDALREESGFEPEDLMRAEAPEIDEVLGKRIIEAILFVSAKPITTRELARILKPLSASQINALIKELKNEYNEQGRSFRIAEIAGGYELSTLPEYSPWLAKLEKEKKAKQASLAALETLAILAYKQPITRVEIEEIRGVDVSGVIATLMDRNFIKIVGRKEVPGRPLLYGTTDLFLAHFGLKSLSDLPDLDEIKNLVEDTIKREELLRQETIVSNEINTEEEVATQTEEEAEQKVDLAAKYDEISKQIEEVKVMSKKQVAQIINPQEASENQPEQSDAPAEEKAPDHSAAQNEANETARHADAASSAMQNDKE